MILRRETNIYDDEAIKNSIASVDKKVSATYGTCSTAAGTSAKLVTLEDFTLFRGAQISVFFSYANTVASPTLNVNGTGAKAIWARGTAIAAQYYWSANSTHTFTYDGTHWVLENAESQEEVYKRLTNNGQNTGLYIENGSLYMNATYIHSGTLSANYIYGGTLKLGGSSGTTGGDGSLIVYNAAGTQVGKWDKNGINVTTGTISGNVITAGKITSANGKVYFDLANNVLACDRMISTSTNTNVSTLVAALKYTDTTKYGFNLSRNTSTTGNIFLNPATTTSGTSVMLVDGALNIYSTGCDLLASKAPSFNISNASNCSVGMSCNGTYIRIYESVNNSHLVHILGSTYIGAKLTVTQGLTVSRTKNRRADTSDYGQRLLYCYEMPSPMFGDVGEGVIAEDGKCYIWIDSIFAETVSLNQYQVFLQKYGEGDCWVSAKTAAYFVVEGTPNMSFGWEVKAKQSDYDQLRLEKDVGDFETRNSMDYAENLINHIKEIRSEREVNAA